MTQFSLDAARPERGIIERPCSHARIEREGLDGRRNQHLPVYLQLQLQLQLQLAVARRGWNELKDVRH